MQETVCAIAVFGIWVADSIVDAIEWQLAIKVRSTVRTYAVVDGAGVLVEANAVVYAPFTSAGFLVEDIAGGAGNGVRNGGQVDTTQAHTLMVVVAALGHRTQAA